MFLYILSPARSILKRFATLRTSSLIVFEITFLTLAFLSISKEAPVFERRDEETEEIKGYAIFNVIKRKEKQPKEIVVDLPEFN